MQRILSLIRTNPILSVIALLTGIILVVGSLYQLLPQEVDPVDNRTPEQILQDAGITDIPESEPEVEYLADKLITDEYQEPPDNTVEVDGVILRANLPQSGPGYSITYDQPNIVIEYESINGLDAALNFLKQFGVLADNRNLQLVAI